ncbi:ATP-binding protein [Nocardioides sp.]|uniref:sensor histidine kinase n=1 Tax=Nocardioides sp. TaxID=35761 RepID=UPI002C9850E4|nr:ATP-binding protein [Nocardioides sp.]HXH78721.1 ATP-binding protein [Nocardioides sp.]
MPYTTDALWDRVSVISERERLAELAGYNVLDTSSEIVFDKIVRAAAEGTGCPTALISLLDEDRQWFKARCGLDVGETPRDQAFCEHALGADAPLIVADATADRRFRDNPLVTGAPGIRFYAGFPLRTPTGAVLGTLCVIGYEPRPEGLTGVQSHLLEVLAEQVMAQLNLRRALAEQADTVAELGTALSSFRALADDATDVVSRHALDGTTLYVSPSVRDVLGYDPDLEVRDAAPERVHPKDSIAMTEALGVVLGGAAATASVRSRHADGSWRHLEIRLSPMFDDKGAIVQIHSVARDVTERHLASERLAELAAEVSTAHHEAVQRGALTDAVLNTVDVGIVACDGDGHLTTFNRATREFHGMPHDPGLDPADWADRYALFAEDGHTPLSLDEVPLFRALSEGVVSGAVMVIAPDGLPARTVRCEGRALRDPTGKVQGAVVAMSDITQSRAAERALAEQAEYTRVLFATVSHDLKTPIAAIKGFAEMVSDPETDTDTRIQFAHRIQARADHVSKLVDELADHVNLRAGSVAITLEPLSLSALARACILGLGPLLEGHRVHIADTDADTVAMVDRGAMDRVLTNLVGNAARYSPVGSALTISFEQTSTLVRISVSDEGRGIDPEDVDIIFDEFARGRLAQDDGGSGLGLASARRLVDLQGGDIRIDSEVGRGTTVTVELPRAHAPASS